MPSFCIPTSGAGASAEGGLTGAASEDPSSKLQQSAISDSEVFKISTAFDFARAENGLASFRALDASDRFAFTEAQRKLALEAEPATSRSDLEAKVSVLNWISHNFEH